jgi:fumarylacetoacetate (FAA) hydrolase
MYQGGSDDFIGPQDDIIVPSEDFGIDFEAELAVITGDVPMQANSQQCLDSIRMVMLVNDVTLRNLVPDELSKGFGFFQSKPSTAFSPVAVTLDELSDSFDNGRFFLTLESIWNGNLVGKCEAGAEMTFSFAQLIQHITKTRRVRAGSIIGSGTVSNKDWSHGYSCIAEKRAIETIEIGKPVTQFMRFGDTICIRVRSADEESVFGAIEQKVVQLKL